MELKLKVSPVEAEEILDSVPHDKFQKSRKKYWVVKEDGNIRPQSIFWLFCWAFNGDRSADAAAWCEDVFNQIMPFSYDDFLAKVGYDVSNRLRYSNMVIDSSSITRLFEE